MSSRLRSWRCLRPPALINQAAKTNGISHSRARRVLVEQGLVEEDRRPVGKAEAKARFFELLDAGWSASRAASEVGVHVRTARDWRDGVRKIGNTRVRPDGVVIRYGTGPAQRQRPNDHGHQWLNRR